MSYNVNVGDYLYSRARLNPQKEALYDVAADKRFTYTELNLRANQCCAALQKLGLKKGERVGVLCQNRHEFTTSFFGPAKVGIVVVPLNWRLTPAELSFIIQDAGIKCLIFDTEFAAPVEEIKAADTGIEHFISIGPDTPDFAQDFDGLLESGSTDEPSDKAEGDDNLFIMYTSGTTGNPKGVVHTHNTVMWAVITLNNTADSRENDKYLVMLPLFHVGALAPLIGAMYKGNSLTILQQFDPENAWNIIQQEQITTTLAVPAMLNFMLQVPDFERFDVSSLRYISSGAAPVPVALIERYQALDIKIQQVYGMTETCGPACMIGAEDAVRKVGSTGKAFFHTAVRIVDENGNDQPPGVPGEVLIRGQHIMKEYWNRPEATAETLVDGWLYSGDIAVMDEEGFVTIQDRLKDMIISGGENVYPAEIENLLLSHPQVADAAVIGQNSEKWGESPLAIVVKQDDALTAEDVLKHCDGKLARFKLPKGVEFIDVIPRNPSGKILKRILREQFSSPAAE